MTKALLWIVPGLVGAIAGALSGFLGIGGGVIFVPAFIGLLRIDPKLAVGTSLAAMAPTVILNAIAHYRYGNVDPRLALVVVPTAVIGGQLGSWLTTLVSATLLRRIFGIVLIFIGLQLLLGSAVNKGH